MGLKIRYGGNILDFSDAKYDPQNFGQMRLNIRTGPSSNDVKKYGLGSTVEQSSDARFKVRVSDKNYYIGTSKITSRQSNYTSSSTYYTYTYTSGYPQSAPMTRQGTQTTSTKTMPAKYTYEAIYYTTRATLYTTYTQTHLVTRTALLSSTRQSDYQTWRASNYQTWRASDYQTSRASNYTAYWNWPFSSYRGYQNIKTVIRKASNRKHSFANGSTSYSYTNTMAFENEGTGVYTSSTGTHPGMVLTTRVLTYNTQANRYEARTNTKGATIEATYYQTQSFSNYSWVNSAQIAAVVSTRRSNYNTTRSSAYTTTRSSAYTTTRSSAYAVAPPNYLALGNAVTTAMDGRTGSFIDNPQLYINSTNSTRTGYDSQNGSYSFRFWTSVLITNQNYSAVNQGLAVTYTSTVTPFANIPNTYTVVSNPYIKSSQQSYTYTDADCTRTYQSVYSTSYWTNTSTHTSNNPTSSSVGTTATTRSSSYITHNFI